MNPNSPAQASEDPPASGAQEPPASGVEAPEANRPPGASAEPGTERLEKAVRAAEAALIEYEIAVETFRVEVENFSRLHHQRLGPVYARLDELEAQIAETIAARTGDPEDIRKADAARGAVLPMPQVEELFFGWIDSTGMLPEAQAMLNEQPVSPPGRVRPSEDARKAYRDLVRKAHPDLAQDDAERERREAFLVRVNKAYADGDAPALAALAEEWEAGPLPGPVAELLRSEELYARLEWLARRKEMLAEMAAELEESAIGAMLKLAPDDPDALLDEIAEQLLGQVAEREQELARLREGEQE
ncbi:J domain-containing protein [Streptomyces sp. NPDC006992]|uniref:J domain-containing protein n=1 Tax=unclassified Streptomyces TaxID=2593676 RepID=UPI0033DEAE06